MVQDFSRPVLSNTDKAYLKGAQKPLQVAREVLNDLKEIGLDVEDDLATVENIENVRAGLLDRFSTKQPRRTS